MPRLPLALIAAVVVMGLGGVPFAQSQTESPADQATPAAKKKSAMTPEEKAQLKAERVAKRKGMTPEEKAKLKEERVAKKQAAAAKKAKRQECVVQGKQEGLKGPKLREFMKNCTAG